VSSSITIRPADDLISGRDRLLHRWRCVGGSNRVPELCGRGPPRNIMVDVGRRCFTTGEQNNQTEPTENSTKRQHGREPATIRSRNSRSYEERSGGVSAYRRIGVSQRRLSHEESDLGVTSKLIRSYSVGATTNRSRHRSMLPYASFNGAGIHRVAAWRLRVGIGFWQLFGAELSGAFKQSQTMATAVSSTAKHPAPNKISGSRPSQRPHGTVAATENTPTRHVPSPKLRCVFELLNRLVVSGRFEHW
jgi:hypothetical protein